jgi:hypothetical protein
MIAHPPPHYAARLVLAAALDDGMKVTVALAVFVIGLLIFTWPDYLYGVAQCFVRASSIALLGCILASLLRATLAGIIAYVFVLQKAIRIA